ncbi:NADH:flavin oxidoreductase/NADH oxidase family protein [Patulibacter brassicae]|uniref:NADH:flavin oxidoreductase/NADH oxidase family protein n=1 Tax=Patulibacter brassicae TaxID=1705717 RepID=A0ABU4VFV1_9ACTN|nr:NADH:flavin oxidoreductase/NADH oxidase family protein [Patulibacter brassicae]MDX8150004.1 NADH:flavin oxidoreductase/NADH oxidase family protein [Patulibacter brassicae]
MPQPQTTADRVAQLAQPLELPRGGALPNRIAKSALSEQLGDRRGAPSPDLVRLYERWGRGGAGLVVTGNVMVDRRHLGEPRNVIVEDDRDLAALRSWASAAKAGGARAWVQINHPGRQAMWFAGGTRPVAPSAVGASVPGYVRPRELTEGEIGEIVARYATTAAVVARAGFDGVQLHGAHGYLISQFLSPRSNQRTDGWGGDAERRRRFVLEVLRAVRAAVPHDFPVGIKLNSADFQRGGFTEEESADVLAALAEEGIDLIEISGGTYEAPAMIGQVQRESTRQREAYFLEYAETVRDRVPGVPLMVTGGFRGRAAMEDAVGSGACDVVGLGRPLALTPDGPAGLLDGSLERLRDAQPRIGVRTLDGAIDLYWHTRQLHRLGAGGEPHLREPAWRTLLALGVDNGWGALRRKRG